MAIRILLSNRLGEVRWNQAELARSTGIRAATINEMYHETTGRVSLDHLNLICEALQCNLSDILLYVPDPIVKVKTRTGHLKRHIIIPSKQLNTAG